MVTEDDDKAYWDAVEEATELLHEERFREALVLLRDIAKRTPRPSRSCAIAVPLSF